jgi:catalase
MQLQLRRADGDVGVPDPV